MIHDVNRRTILLGAAGAGLLAAAPALAKRRTSVRAISNGRSGDRANEGYDATAYFTRGAAAKGGAGFETAWKGAVWRFENAEALSLFVANPQSYAPQFGGYCTNAMSMKKVVPANPEIWRIRDGKLYLFAAKPGGVKFDADPDAMIAKANAYWRSLTLTE